MIDQDELRLLWSAYEDGVNARNEGKTVRAYGYRGNLLELWKLGYDGLPSGLPDIDLSDDPRIAFMRQS